MAGGVRRVVHSVAYSVTSLGTALPRPYTAVGTWEHSPYVNKQLRGSSSLWVSDDRLFYYTSASLYT